MLANAACLATSVGPVSCVSQQVGSYSTFNACQVCDLDLGLIKEGADAFV